VSQRLPVTERGVVAKGAEPRTETVSDTVRSGGTKVDVEDERAREPALNRRGMGRAIYLSIGLRTLAAYWAKAYLE